MRRRPVIMSRIVLSVHNEILGSVRRSVSMWTASSDTATNEGALQAQWSPGRTMIIVEVLDAAGRHIRLHYVPEKSVSEDEIEAPNFGSA